MRGWFPTLWLILGLMMLGESGSGLIVPGLSRTWFGFASSGIFLVVSGLAVVHFRVMERQVEDRVIAAGLPEWVGAQAEKNRRKASAYLGPGLVLVGLSDGLGWVEDGVGSLVISASSLAYQVGMLVGLFVIGIAQSRLLRDVLVP